MKIEHDIFLLYRKKFPIVFIAVMVKYTILLSISFEASGYRGVYLCPDLTLVMSCG